MLQSKLLAPFGVEIDIDLTRRSEADDAELRELFLRHHLLIFRRQRLTKEEQVDFMSLFGPPLLSSIDGVGYITNEATPENKLGNSELAFHSDLSFSPKPFDAISLHAVEVEDGRSSTRFVDSTQAYQRLPEATKQRIDTLHALQVYGGPNLAGRNHEDIPANLPRHVHPLVMRHPRTAERILYVNYNQTARIPELDKAESDALIEELFAYSYLDEAVYEHGWHNGDLVAWDNLAVQHARGATENVGIRRLQRAVVADVGFFEQYPEFASANGAGMQ